MKSPADTIHEYLEKDTPPGAIIFVDGEEFMVLEDKNEVRLTFMEIAVSTV